MLGGVPDYWTSELEAKANEIQLAMEAAGRNKTAFLWYTDAHWPNGNSKKSPLLLNYLIRNTPMNKVNFGGDIVGSTLLNRDQMGYLYEWREMIADLPNHHSVSGNHDKFSNYPYAFLIAPEESPEMVFGNGAYYYIDNPAEKTRYIYVEYLETSTANANALLEQGKFIVDAINGVSEGWHIVAIAHRWFQYASSSTPTTGSFSAFEGDMLEVFDAYNARVTRNGSNWFYAQDFKDAKGKVEFCIGGHIHVDHDLYSAGGIPVILTASDANQERSGDETEDAGVLGTTTEAAVFGIIADYNDDEKTKITVVGVGRGTSRVIGDTPVNLFDKNDPDIVDAGRFNSSNNIVAYTAGQLVTGYIEAKVGDTFTVQTDKTLKTSVYACDMMCYNASKAAIDNINAAMTAWTVSDDGLTGTITIPASYQFNVDNIVSYEGTAYVRFCVAYTNMDNIVIMKS